MCNKSQDLESLIKKYTEEVMYAYQQSNASKIRKIRTKIFNDKSINCKEPVWERITANALWNINMKNYK